MAKYLKPNTRGDISTFNVDNYSFQTAAITYADAMNLSSNQIVAGEKTYKLSRFGC